MRHRFFYFGMSSVRIDENVIILLIISLPLPRPSLLRSVLSPFLVYFDRFSVSFTLVLPSPISGSFSVSFLLPDHSSAPDSFRCLCIYVENGILSKPTHCRIKSIKHTTTNRSPYTTAQHIRNNDVRLIHNRL